MPTYVPITQIAEELGVNRSHVRKIALRMGFEPVRRQLPDVSHPQRVQCWTREEVDKILAERARQGFIVREKRAKES